jgi:RNA polymerase sigma-70 factor (ECF subfamily)
VTSVLVLGRVSSVSTRTAVPARHSGAVTDEDELARRAAAGDRRALEELLDGCADRVHALCRRVLLDADDALDAAQETLLGVTRGIGRFDGRAAFSTWLYRIATNAALDELRRRNRRPVPSAEVPEAPASAPPVAETVASRVDVDAALATLPPDFRIALVLRDLCDLEYRQIAEVLGVPPGTVRSRIARGRAAFAAAFAPEPVVRRNDA